MTQKLPVKGTLESVVLGFDFSREASSVTTPSITCEVESSDSADDTPGAVLIGSPTIDPTNAAVVLQRVAAGVDLTDYRIECTVATSSGDTLTLPVILPVRARL